MSQGKQRRRLTSSKGRVRARLYFVAVLYSLSIFFFFSILVSLVSYLCPYIIKFLFNKYWGYKRKIKLLRGVIGLIRVLRNYIYMQS